MKTRTIALSLFMVLIFINLASAIRIDADYITVYPGEEGTVRIDVENTGNFDIEDVTVSLDLNNSFFTSIGNSAKDTDDLDEGDDDSVSFVIRPSTDIVPGDYSIPYTISFFEVGNSTTRLTQEGNFGIRVSAETDIDFTVETRDTAIVGREGQISLEIINRGLGEIKSVSVQVIPQGFDILSANKIFVGSIDADDSDTATFDVMFRNANPTFTAKVTYKDFDNNDQTETVNIPVKVYSEEQALELGLIQKSKTMFYFTFIIVLVVLWFVWKRIRKRKKRREEMKAGR